MAGIAFAYFKTLTQFIWVKKKYHSKNFKFLVLKSEITILKRRECFATIKVAKHSFAGGQR